MVYHKGGGESTRGAGRHVILVSQVSVECYKILFNRYHIPYTPWTTV